MRFCKKLTSFFLLFAMAGTVAIAAPPQPRGKVLERIVAVVNGHPILLSDLEGATELFQKEMTVSKKDPDFGRKVLDQLINEKLVTQEIDRRGFTSDDASIDRAVEGVMRQNGFKTKDDLTRALRAEGMSLADYRISIKKQMETSRLINAAIRPKVQIADQDVQDAIRRSHPQTGKEWEMDVAMIFKAKPKGTRKDIKRLRDQLKAGIPFQTIASRETEGPAKKEGGRIGWIFPSTLQPELRKALDKMKPGDTSDIIETKQGFYLLQLADRRRATGPAITSKKPEQVREELERQELDRHFELFVRNLREKAHVEIKL